MVSSLDGFIAKKDNSVSWLNSEGSVEFYSGDLRMLLREKLGPRYQNIWRVGGARNVVASKNGFVELSYSASAV
jgi:hypothetical protein